MAIKISTGFSIGSKDLIDDRLVLTKDQMLNINEAIYPDHFFSLCSDDNKIYVFDVNNDVLDPEVGKFKLYASGEGGVTIDDVTPSTSTVYSSQKIEDTIGKPEHTEKTYTKVYDNLLNKESVEEHEGWYDTDTKDYVFNNGTEKSFVITDGVVAGGNYTATYTGSYHANIYLLDNNLDKIETRDFSLNVTTGTIPENCTTIIISYYSDSYENVSFITGDTDLDGLLKVVKDDTITDENTEIKASDVTGIANIGDFVRIENETQVPSTGLYKYIDDRVGNGSITEDIEVIGVGELGGYKDGDVISKDTDTITSVLKQLLRKVIHPTYIAPTLTVTASPSILEVGVESAITVTPKFTQNDAGLVNTYQGYRNDTALSQDESRLEETVFNYTPTDTTSIFYKYEITYHEGITKQNNFGESDPTGKIMDGSLTKTSSLISVVYPTFYGATDIVPTTSDEITALTKLVRVKNDLAQLFTVDNKYIVYAYPSSFGDLTSIIDSNGFENITDFTKTTIEVTTTTGYNTTYNVYTTNSKKTVDNFKFTFKF